MTMTKTALGIIIALAFVGCKGQVAVGSAGDAEEAAPAEEEAPVEEAPAEEEAEEEAPAEEAEAAAPVDDDVVLEGDEFKIKKKILFASGKDEILPESNELLDKIAKVMNANPQVKKVRVVGHTDLVGDAKANLTLSDKRAKAVVKALEERKVTVKLQGVGKGEEKPLCKEETDECNQQNRRVQFNVIP